MTLFSTHFRLQSGANVTVQAWSYLHFAANYADYRALLAAFRERVGGTSGDEPQQLLLDRVVLASVPKLEDRELLGAADLPDLLVAIAELNTLPDIAGKALDLLQQLQQAELQALAPELSTTTSPS